MEKGLISVDRWSEESQAYFLSHLHADHTKGLSSRWARGPLFCSPVSAKLFSSKFPKFDLFFLRVLDIGAAHSLTLVSPTTGKEVRVQVTPIEAHHCPGAVMFLFRGDFGCVLYTGDFRWELSADRVHMGKEMLLNALGGDRVDVLYLDNTYCHPSYFFPSRVVAAQQVVDIITSYPEHDIVIGINTLGKEDLLLHISHTLNTKIWVWPERLQTMHLLGYYDIFTTSTSATRVRAVPCYSLTVHCLEALNSLRPTIGIMPSGLPYAVKFEECSTHIGSSAPRRYHQYIYSVLYSDHSCFSEMEEFLKLVRPLKMTGVVYSSICYINPHRYFGNLCGVSEASRQSDDRFKESRTRSDGIGNRAGVSQPESILGHGVTGKAKVKKVRSVKIAILAVRRSRVSLLRRNRCGAKIAYSD